MTEPNADLIGFEFEVEDPERLGKRATARVTGFSSDGQYAIIRIVCHEDGALFLSCRSLHHVRQAKDTETMRRAMGDRFQRPEVLDLYPEVD